MRTRDEWKGILVAEGRLLARRPGGIGAPSALGLLMAMGVDSADRTRADESRPGLPTT